MKYKGNIGQLKAIIVSTKVNGIWCGDGDKMYQFRDDAGGIMNWWPSTGTISFQGKEQRKKELSKIVCRKLWSSRSYKKEAS